MARKNIFNYDTLVHAIAGATGSMVAMSVMYPLDNIKFRMQLQDELLHGKTPLEALVYVLRTEGIESLYCGIKPALKTLGASNFIYFYAFHGLKSLDLNPLGSPTKTDLVLSIVAGVANVLLTNPLWVVNSRLKFRSKDLYYTGLLDGLVHIATTEGLKTLWSGLSSSLLLVSHPAINFTLYEALKRRTNAKSAAAFFLIGAFSKAISTVATYPIQVVQARQRFNKNVSRSTAAVLLNILKQQGFRGIYQGLDAKLLQTILSSALMFMTYEKIAQFVFYILLTRNKIRPLKG